MKEEKKRFKIQNCNNLNENNNMNVKRVLIFHMQL